MSLLDCTAVELAAKIKAGEVTAYELFPYKFYFFQNNDAENVEVYYNSSV